MLYVSKLHQKPSNLPCSKCNLLHTSIKFWIQGSRIPSNLLGPGMGRGPGIGMITLQSGLDEEVGVSCSSSAAITWELDSTIADST